MTDGALAEVIDDSDVVCCPHCDALLHGPTEWCRCAGCDNCERARKLAAFIAAAELEWRRRHPVQSTLAPVPADKPF